MRVRVALLLFCALVGSAALAANPVPLLDNPVNPSTVLPGSAQIELAVTGSGFVSGSVVQWNGSTRTTTFVSDRKLTATIPASDLAAATSAFVTVVSPAPGGGRSNTAYFQVASPRATLTFKKKATYAAGSQDLAQPFKESEQELYVSASIGISLFPRDGAAPEELVKHADTAMYSAKDSGRNSYCYFTQGLNLEVREKVMMESGLRRAIARGELRLFYQPKIDLSSGRVIGAESLVRWQHPTLGLVSPAKFIPIAEESGLIVPLGEWVLHAACEQLRRWQLEGHELQVAINVSARQFRQRNLAELVLRAMADSHIDPRFVEIEVTESAIMNDAQSSIATLEAMKAHGISISIDDFGTGYSSLSYLKRLPLDILKIDQSFVRDITTDHNDAAIVRAIIGLARSLGKKVIAEGVEDDNQLSFLNAYGCNYGQGYLFGKPLDPAMFIEVMRAQGAQRH